MMLLKEAGIDQIIGPDDLWTGEDGMLEMLDRAEQFGISVIPNLRGWDLNEVEELEAEFNVLLQQPDSAAKNAERFGSIANEMASLKEQREKIAARLRKDQAVQSHVQTMERQF